MKTKKHKKRKNKAKSTFLLVLIYGFALFYANIGIDRLKMMSPEEFWGMFESRTIVIENVAVAATIAQEAPKEPEPVKVPEYTQTARLTAYNSVPEQTDGNPCISADGTNICEFKGCVVAQNGVRFGTKVEIEGIGVCHVHDRKNSRYDSSWIDIYYGGKEKVGEALKFGTKEARYRVIE